MPRLILITVTTLFQATQAVPGGAEPHVTGGTAAPAARGQLAPVPFGHHPGRALPPCQPHHQPAPPGHAGPHHHQRR